MSYENKGTVSNTVYVSREPDRSGNYICDGTADDVQINLAEAYVTALGGGTVELGRGTFVLADPIIPTGNRVWYKGQGRDTFLDGDGLATTEHAFHITGRDDIIISDLAIQTEDGGDKTCHCIFIEDGADRFLIDNVWIVASDVNGIHVEGSDIDYGRIQHCHITGCDDDGIYATMDGANYADYLTVSDNDIWGNGDDGIEFVYRVRNALVKVNQINGNTGFGVNISDATSVDNVVENNMLDGNAAGAINDEGTDTVLPMVEWLATYGDDGINLVGDVPVADLQLAQEAAVGFTCPNDLQQLVRAYLMVLPNATHAAANWDIFSDYGTVGEAPNTHSEQDIATTYNVTNNQWYDIELVALGFFANLAMGDRGGIRLLISTPAHHVSVFGLRFEYV